MLSRFLISSQWEGGGIKCPLNAHTVALLTFKPKISRFLQKCLHRVVIEGQIIKLLATLAPPIAIQPDSHI